MKSAFQQKAVPAISWLPAPSTDPLSDLFCEYRTGAATPSRCPRPSSPTTGRSAQPRLPERDCADENRAYRPHRQTVVQANCVEFIQHADRRSACSGVAQLMRIDESGTARHENGHRLSRRLATQKFVNAHGASIIVRVHPFCGAPRHEAKTDTGRTFHVDQRTH